MAAQSTQLRRPAGTWSFRIARVFGVDLFLHATFLILLAWVALSYLLTGQGVGAAISGLVLVIFVFAIVVLHELGHALTARAFGYQTRNITLLPIGGVAQLERLPEKPFQQLLVSLSGPAVNVVLAAVLAGFVLATGGSLREGGMHVVGGSLLSKLFWVNVSLAVFNLLPAFPMDGGRVLRAVLAFRMDPTRATEIAARTGQGIALLFAVVGLFGNPILLFIALFVWIGAHQEASMARTRSALADVPVKAAMITEFRTLDPAEPLGHAARFLLEGFQHDFPVSSGGRPVGLLTRDDVVRGLSKGGASSAVGEWMHTGFVAADADDPLDSSFTRALEADMPTLLVTEDGRVVGLVTPDNIAELLLLRRVLAGSRRQDVASRGLDTRGPGAP